MVYALALLVLITPATAQQGGIVNNSGKIPFNQAFFAFEVESPLESLKDTPIWDELEQMLDNPYQFALDPTVLGNYQGWPSYRVTQPRRRSFIFRNAAGQPCAPFSAGCNEVPLPRHVIHPPNYNYQGGEELRLLNIGFEGADWLVPDQLVQCLVPNTPAGCPAIPDPNRWEWTYKTVEVSPGVERVEDDEVSIDYNSPVAPDTRACIISTEPIPAEGAVVCGGDPGEPGYAGFGVLRGAARRGEQYSTPALPRPVGRRTPGADITPGIGTGNNRLFDPARGFINPRVGANGGLRKPSLRIAPWGAPANPGYLVNSEADLAADPAALVPSNENDYYRGANRTQKVTARTEAATLGKALFWDMQVGSDTVQACASCHFNAGADNRTKNQTNPNHLGGDLTLQLHGGVQNTDVTVADFPLHRGPQDSTDPDSHVNDVVSSMGVRFRQFVDIPTPGTAAFGAADATGVRTLLPDVGNAVPDPIPLFEGLRRVEPRNTPTLFNAAMNFDNFWDGRARHDFNGGSVFGATDPQSHVFVAAGPNSNLTATRQIIRFASLASLATGPGLSDFEMSFAGRNWPKVGKKLLQGDHTGGPAGKNRVVPLANQLVDPTDSVLGRYSNQGGSACGDLLPRERSVAGPTAAGKPGLCISYPAMIKRAFYPDLWHSELWHLNGCYTDGNFAIHPNQCVTQGVSVAIPVLDGSNVVDSASDPFDGYVLTPAAGPAVATETNQFTQMEANMSLFFGLSVHAWGLMLVPDDSPFDRFMDENPDSFVSFGESGEANLVLDLLRCDQTGGVQPCFTEVGNFKRDPNVVAKLNCTGPGACTSAASGGTRAPGSRDPLFGLDVFLGSNLSLKNPNYRSLRCGECHAQGTLTDHTFDISHQASFNDWVVEFFPGRPGSEIFPEPLGRNRVIAGFALEGEINGNAQDAIERNAADFCAVEPCQDANGNPIAGGVVGGFPQGQALFDNGVYNLGVTPIANDVARGGKDPFGWPLSLAYLALKNLGGVAYSPGGDDPTNGFAQPQSPGIPLPNFDPSIDPTSGGLLDPSAQDQQINPGFEEEPANPLLPAYLAPWASNIVVGDEVQIDEVFMGLNTLAAEPQLEGFIDNFGPFNPAAILGENMNNAIGDQMGTWPNVNRVNAQGSFKAAPLHHVARTGPYFHNGGKLTLRQVLDFYLRGGDFPRSNAAHRDFLILNLDLEDEAMGGFVNPATGLPVAPGTAGAVPEFTEAQKEEIRVAVIDFLLELTDERVDFQRATFDQPEIFVPLDGTAPDNGSLAGVAAAGRPGFLNNLANGMFQRVPPTGAGGKATPSPNFLGISDGPRLLGGAANCAVVNNHYCH
jgi:cytochrome c peroxidase